MKHDVVYILKNNPPVDELRYSLRTVEKNFPFRKVWIFGGCPKEIKPDEYVEILQTGGTKWEKSTNTLRAICCNNDVTPDFWLFNDDFFIMKKVSDLPYMIRGTIAERVTDLRKKNGISRYSMNLEETAWVLQQAGKETLDYALHVPMLINRAKALEVLDAFPRCPMFRCLYGNYWQLGGEVVKDVKIYNPNNEPDEDMGLLSTMEESFAGKTGDFIKERFTKPSRWERDI